MVYALCRFRSTFAAGQAWCRRPRFCTGDTRTFVTAELARGLADTAHDRWWTVVRWLPCSVVRVQDVVNIRPFVFGGGGLVTAFRQSPAHRDMPLVVVVPHAHVPATTVLDGWVYGTAAFSRPHAHCLLPAVIVTGDYYAAVTTTARAVAATCTVAVTTQRVHVRGTTQLDLQAGLPKIGRTTLVLQSSHWLYDVTQLYSTLPGR